MEYIDKKIILDVIKDIKWHLENGCIRNNKYFQSLSKILYEGLSNSENFIKIKVPEKTFALL